MESANSFSLIDFLKILIKWRWPIIVVSIVTAVVSTGVSLILPEYFESRTIFYPSNPSLVDRQYLFGQQGGDQLVSYFGAGDDLDRAMTVAKSPALRNHLITKFNLKEHYGIKDDDKYPLTKVNEEFQDNYSAIKNEYDAVEITVLDTSRVLAAAIANEAAAKIDAMMKGMTLENKQSIVEVFRKSEVSKKKEISAITDSIAALRSQGETEKLGYFVSRRESMVEDLNEIATLHEQYQASLSMNIPTLYIVESAYPSEKKKYPVRWLIVLSSTLIAAFIMMLFVTLLERYKAIQPELARD